MSILLCGFEPFGERDINNAWEVVKQFQGIPDIDVLMLPVSFNRSHKVIIEALRRKKYDLVIMLGETSITTDYVRLERLAINYKDSTKPDNDGIIADDELIVENAPKAYFSSLPIKRFATHLRELDYRVKASNSAGTFVCNSLYYQVLRYIDESGSNTAALFLHLPVTSEIVSMEEMKNIIIAILSFYNLSR